jgi:hypothetical protein
MAALTRSRVHPLAAGGAALVALYLVVFAIAASAAFARAPDRIALGVTLDLTVTATRTVPEGALNLALMEPTVLVTLRAPAEIRGLLGRRRHADRLALTIDDPKAFAAAVG